MPRLALKPDSSFFRKIATGVVGTRGVCADLASLGHELVELERGSLDTKLWKDVKRKRVRIPDLVCPRCGLRVESRAKTKPELSMSHSATDVARAWDFGMVDSDCVAFPVCQATQERQWTSGRLGSDSSYWHERNWVHWQLAGAINYFRVGAFRSAPHTRSRAKGVTEGSETIISWNAKFSSRVGTVEAADERRMTIKRASDGHVHTSAVPIGLHAFVRPGEHVETGQLLASTVTPLTRADLTCSGRLPDGYIDRLLTSRERTQRFTGVKLARLRQEQKYADQVSGLMADQEEDVYIRLEAASYLAAVASLPTGDLFASFVESPDHQLQLEAVITLGEAGTQESVDVLSGVLDDTNRPYFLRSAAAWCLSRTGGEKAATRLVRAFSDVDSSIREEALEGLVTIGGSAVPVLLTGLQETDQAIAAGCAEALRQQYPLAEDVIATLVASIQSRKPSQWNVWLLGHLPRERVSASIAQLQDSAPQLHYAVSLLWSFVESWISRRWELNARPAFPSKDEGHAV